MSQPPENNVLGGMARSVADILKSEQGEEIYRSLDSILRTPTDELPPPPPRRRGKTRPEPKERSSYLVPAVMCGLTVLCAALLGKNWLLYGGSITVLVQILRPFFPARRR